MRGVLKRQKNATVLLAEATDIDVAQHCVRLSDGELPYDTLIVGSGASHYYFGHDEWAPVAPGLKTIENATEIRHRVFLAFEAAEREPDAQRRRAWLTFVIVGGGPTGVELAGALAEIARHTLTQDFRTINPADARILLVEGADRLLPPYAPILSSKAAATLTRLGVSVETSAHVVAIDRTGVDVKRDGATQRVPSHTVLWAAGVQASPLGAVLAARAGATLDRAGRVVVAPDCTVPGHPEIFVIGDLASFSPENTGKPLPGVAPVAMQQGRYAATVIQRRLRGETLPAFTYHDRGSMAVIGRGAAVADVKGVRFDGFLAWLTWLFIHLMYLVEFDNRLLVLTQWALNYFTWNRGARLITGENPLPLIK